MQRSILRHCAENWRSALTVALVNIPLSLALAIASGATPTQGIITAFWAGILGALFGGGHYNIIGPTGALSGVLIAFALTHGYIVLPLVAICSGILILCGYFLQFDRYIVFIPRSVVQGFTLGVAFIIALGQLDNILGLTGLHKTENLLENVWITILHAANVQWLTLGIFIVSTVFIIVWNRKFPRVPGAICIAFVGILSAYSARELGIHFPLTLLADKYSDVHGTLFSNSFSTFSWKMLLSADLWIISIATAVIAILETLLSGQIADRMTGTKFNRSKELLALAIANIGSGIMGGIPATAALARTALNIKSGALHRTSGVMGAIILGIIVLFFFTFFRLLPMVAIASILVVVAIGMIEKKHFIRLIENEKTNFGLAIFVAVVTIVKDPIFGIASGTIVALLIFVNKVAYGQTEILVWKNGKMIDSLLKDEFIKNGTHDSDLIVYKISGTLTYINMPAHLHAAKKIQGNNHVIVSLRHAFYADSDGIEYLKEIIEVLKKHNGTVILCGVNKEIEKLIKHEDFYKQKLIDGKIYARTSEAIRAITGE